MSEPWWSPSHEILEQCNVERFRRKVNATYGLQLQDYWDLHRWSCDSPNDFWTLLWTSEGILGDVGAPPLFDVPPRLEQTKQLLPRARINFAENALLSHRHARSSDRTAVISACESDKTLRTLTWRELHDEVAHCANALKQAGVTSGDCVAAYTPNNAEAVVFVLAAAAIGAISSTVAAEFQPAAVLERLEQIKPKILLTADEYRYNGKTLPLLSKAAEVAKVLKGHGLERIVVVGHLKRSRQPSRLPREAGKVPLVSYTDFVQNQSSVVDFWRGPAMTPLWVLYSSGTTGKAKAIVHTHGGMTLCGKALHSLSCNLGERDVVFQYTTFSWMMANWLIQCLLVGASIVCYDGSPLAPTSILWDLVDQHGCTNLGVSPRYLQVLLSNGYKPRDRHSLRTLTTLCTTGAPLKPELYDFIRDAVGSELWLNNSSGGTDVCCAFLGAIKSLPIYKGELTAPILGCALEVWSDDGGQVRDGEEGNLVVTRSFPNAPLCFWDDEGDKKLRDAYFNTFAPKYSVWDHSDWLVRNPQTRGFTMLGRSDATLNPSGVRFGSSEIYAAVEDLKDVVDDCKLPDGDERVILFVKTVNDSPLQDKDVERIKKSIREKRSTRHVPAKIIQTPAIPYTATNKRIEVAVKKLINGATLDKINRSGMANPESLAFYVDRPELQLGVSAKL